MAAKPISTARHLYSVPLPAASDIGKAVVPAVEPKALSDVVSESASFYTVDFSPQAGYYILSYEGPGVPWQKIVKTGDPGV